MCFPRGEFRVGQRDVLLGELEGTPFYIGGHQFEVWQHTQLLIDVVPGLRLRLLARGAARGQVPHPLAGVRSGGAGVAGCVRDAAGQRGSGAVKAVRRYGGTAVRRYGGRCLAPSFRALRLPRG